MQSTSYREGGNVAVSLFRKEERQDRQRRGLSRHCTTHYEVQHRMMTHSQEWVVMALEISGVIPECVWKTRAVRLR